VRAGWRLRRLADGSAVVARRVSRAFVPLDEDGELRLLATAVRCGPAVLAAPRLLDLAHQSPVWLVGGTGAWCVAAWRARPGKPQAADGAEAKEEPLQEPDPTDLRQAVVDRLLDWVGDRRGIHLAEVYERYRELPGHGHLTDTQIRASLVDHYAVPVRPAVRTPDGVRAGIHRDDLQPLPSPAVADTVAEERNSTVTSTVAA
jgi:hypothetical protein